MGDVPTALVDLADLGLDGGGHLLLDRSLGRLCARPAADGDRAWSGAEPSTWAPGAAAHGHRLIERQPFERRRIGRDSALDGGEALVDREGRQQRTALGGAERAGSAAGSPDARADPRWGLAARGALVEAGGPPIGAHWSEREHVWADIAPKLYAAAAASQWDPATAVDWAAADRRRPARDRAGRRPDHDLPGRERAGGADHPGPAAVPAAPALPRGHAAARHPGSGRGAARGGVHSPGAAIGRAPRHLLGRRPSVAGDAAERARLHHRVVPTVGAGRGHLPRPAPVPARACPGPGHRRRDQARAARRGTARGVRRRAHRPPGGSIPLTWARSAGRSNAGTPRCRTPPG